MSIGVLPVAHPAHGLELDRPCRDELGADTTLAVLERRAASRPTFGNVRALYSALDAVYPGWTGETGRYAVDCADGATATFEGTRYNALELAREIVARRFSPGMAGPFTVSMLEPNGRTGEYPVIGTFER